VKLSQTHTLVDLDVPQEFHDYVVNRLKEAGYTHALLERGDGTYAVDMTGIALVPSEN